MKSCLLFLLCLIALSNRVAAQAWTEIGSGSGALNANNAIFKLVSDTAGNVYAAGDFTNAGGKQYVAKWDGATWSELGGAGALNANGKIHAMCTDRYGNIYAAGGFTDAAGHWRVGKWNGTNWSDLDTLLINNNIRAVCSDAIGNIYAAGHFINSSGSSSIIKWDGTAWTELGTGIGIGFGSTSIFTLTADNAGNVYAAGSCWTVGGYYVAKWNGTTWAELGTLNANGPIEALCTDDSGNIYAAGDFGDSLATPYVAKWNGSAWAEVGTGSGALNANAQISSIATVPGTSTLLAAGMFTDATGRYYVASWYGTAWSSLGESVTNMGYICSVSLDKTGHVYAAGWFGNPAGKKYVAKYSAIVPIGVPDVHKVGVKIYPNPAMNMIHVTIPELTEEASYTVTDITGARILTGTLSTSTDIDVNMLPVGMYVLYAGENIGTFKFVKE